jgi:hypothetical protein
MTEQFEKWCIDVKKKHPDYDRYAITDEEQNHFWISAFVKEVRDRRGVTLGNKWKRPVGDAFEEVVRDFGLDGEK